VAGTERVAAVERSCCFVFYRYSVNGLEIFVDLSVFENYEHIPFYRASLC